jgi:hypothetical protein
VPENVAKPNENLEEKKTKELNFPQKKSAIKKKPYFLI